MADVVAFGSTVVMPDFAAVAGVHGPNVVGGGEVENAVDFERSRLELLVRRKNPGERERMDVCGIDLVERAETPAGIVAVVGGPGVRGGLEQSGRVEPLRGNEGRAQEESNKQQKDCSSSCVQIEVGTRDV